MYTAYSHDEPIAIAAAVFVFVCCFLGCGFCLQNMCRHLKKVKVGLAVQLLFLCTTTTSYPNLTLHHMSLSQAVNCCLLLSSVYEC